jgi:hypothetical protein
LIDEKEIIVGKVRELIENPEFPNLRFYQMPPKVKTVKK